MTTIGKAPMVRSLKNLIGYPIEAVDGDVGKVTDFFFDDELKIIRYLVVDTGDWLTPDHVLISSLHCKQPDLGVGRHFPVDLTEDQIEKSPPIEFDKPISRQYEEAFAKYYNQPHYWNQPPTGRHVPVPPTPEGENPSAPASIRGDSCLRSFEEVNSYDISGTDGDLGHLEDMIAECKTWRLRYIVVDTHRWLPGGKVILDIDWLESFDYVARKTSVDLTKEQIKSAPKYRSHELVNEDYQENLYDYYGRPAPWEFPATPY